jgi:hypothetical protein
MSLSWFIGCTAEELRHERQHGATSYLVDVLLYLSSSCVVLYPRLPHSADTAEPDAPLCGVGDHLKLAMQILTGLHLASSCVKAGAGGQVASGSQPCAWAEGADSSECNLSTIDWCPASGAAHPKAGGRCTSKPKPGARLYCVERNLPISQPQ